MISMATKSWLSLPLAVMAIVNLFTILELLGRAEKRFDPKRLRLVHRTVGLVALVWILLISFFCLAILRASGGDMTPRGALHAVTAILVVVVLTVKIVLVRYYRKLFSFIPPMGFVVFALLMTTLALSAGTYLLTRPAPVTAQTAAPTEAGRKVFEARCADCHYADKGETKIGPGLKGLSSSGELPVSKRPATAENMRLQMEKPYRNMPSFTDLPAADKDALVRYLLTL